MVKTLLKKAKPKSGFAHFFHIGLIAIIPPLVFIFVRLEIVGLAIAIILLGKWRMLAVKPRHWIAHIRTNAVDLIVSFSILSFMVAYYESFVAQIVWLIIFEIWVLYLKPGTSAFMVGFQALTAQLAGVTAVFLAFPDAPIIIYVLTAGLVGYFCSRHFFGGFEETHGIQYSWLWSFFSASLVWIMSHWLLFYGPVAQPAVFLAVIGYGLAGLYFLHEHDKLTQMVRRQIIFAVVSVLFIMVALSNWGDGIVK